MGPFELQLRQFAEKYGEQGEEMVATVALEVFRRVVVRSPVDTGRFRANWQYGVDVATGKVFDSPAWTPQSPAPAPTEPEPARSLEIVHVISNHLPYARRLEWGHSAQAPAGMVRITVAEFEGIVDKAARTA